MEKAGFRSLSKSEVVLCDDFTFHFVYILSKCKKAFDICMV